MSATPKDAFRDRSSLKPELGYILERPGSPSPPDHEPTWRAPETDPVKAMTDGLVEAEWSVAHLRQLIETMGETPRGRTRSSLAEQLSAAFMDRTRIARAFADLSEEERRYYANSLLQSSLQSYETAPEMQSLWRGFTRPWHKLSARLKEVGLIVESDDGEIVVPFGTRSRLPHFAIPFRQAAEPSQVVAAADPHGLLAQVQQLLGLLQAERFEIRDRLRWKAPEYPYAQPVVCWPPVPEDARKLYASAELERAIELWPPEPVLDDEALQTWSRALGVPETWAEFLYHILRVGGMIWTGSPLVVDEELAQAWMALPPGRQLAMLYRIYCNITPWAAWWPHWRDGTIRVHRDHYGYWGLISLDETLRLSGMTLRWILLEVLAYLPDRTWLAMDDIVELIAQLFPTSDTHRYLVRLRPEHAQEGWVGFLRLALEEMVKGPLRALGLVAFGPSAEDIQAIRLQGLQDLHWGRVTELQVEAAAQLSPEAVRFLPAKTTLEVKTPIPPEFMSFLLRWARPAGFSRGLVTYSLDVSGLHQAFESGQDPEALTEAWRECAGFDPPAEIVDWWRSWWNRYGQVRLYPVQTLLETRDVFTMQELQVALPGLSSLILGMLTPSAALIESEDADQILEDLVRQGYMPKELS